MSIITQAQPEFVVWTDFDYAASHKRHRIVVWSGPMYKTFEAEGLSLPWGQGYMLTTYNGDKVRVKCSAPRDPLNSEEVDLAIRSALLAHYKKVGAVLATDSAQITEVAGGAFVRCPACSVTMESNVFHPHQSICVADARTTRVWLNADSGSHETSKPVRTGRFRWYDIVGLSVASLLGAVAISLLVLAFALDLVWP